MKEPGMDVLSDVLTTVRLHSAIHFCPGLSAPWLEATLKSLAAESTSEVPGAQLIMARLTDVLCVQILRAYIAQEATEGQTCDQQAGMLRALRDPHLGKALALMHQQPEH